MLRPEEWIPRCSSCWRHPSREAPEERVQRKLLLYMVGSASMLHIWWGLIVLLDRDAAKFTTIALLSQVFWNPLVLGYGLIGIGLYSLYEIALPREANLATLLPQQCLLMVSAIGDLHAIYIGQYPDGTLRSWLFISGDQMPALIISIIHTIALFEVYTLSRWNQRSHLLRSPSP